MSLHTRRPAVLLRTAPPAWLYGLVVFAAAWLGFWIQRLKRVTDQLVSILILLRQRRSVGWPGGPAGIRLTARRGRLPAERQPELPRVLGRIVVRRRAPARLLRHRHVAGAVIR